MTTTSRQAATTARRAWARPIVRTVAAISLGIQRPLLRRRLGRAVLERVDGVPIVVLPDTFNPVVFRTGAFLARAIPELAYAYPAGHRSALDMGTGSGIGAVFAARAGWSVTAVDINPSACRCARINAALNGLEGAIEVLEGDLFKPIAGRVFDLILFNPPFFRGNPRDDLDRAWHGTDILERFATGAGHVLAPGGRITFVLSSHGEGDCLARLLEKERLSVRAIRRRDFGSEILTVFEARREVHKP